MWSDEDERGRSKSSRRSIGKFKIYGTIEYRVEIGTNSIIGHGYGPFIVEFEDGHKIEILSPKSEINGITLG